MAHAQRIARAIAGAERRVRIASPVISSGPILGTLAEVVGDAARLFDPHEPAAIADAVRDVLAEPAPWIERGLAHAARFSWDDTARATDAVYAELL